MHCTNASFACPGGILTQVWLRRPDDVWRLVSTVCVPIGSSIVSPTELIPDVAEAFRRLPLPAPRLHVQPPNDPVVNLPAILYADPESAHAVTVTVEGFTVHLRAEAVTWRWNFGDHGAEVVTDSAGAPYPRHVAEYTYRRPGPRTVTAAAVWRGRYRIAGTDVEVAVPDEVVRAASATVRVVTARAQLVGDGRR